MFTEIQKLIVHPFGQYQIRLLKSNDDGHNYCQLLNYLTEAPDIPNEEFKQLVDKQLSPDKGYFVLVAETANKLVASVTLLVEQKLIHGGAKVGHIEDVVVHPDHRGQKLAQELLKTAQQVAKEVGCYKIILDCRPELANFYGKIGFTQKGIEMRYDV